MDEIRGTESLAQFVTSTTPNVNNTERAVSAVAGGALIAYGLKHGGVVGTLSALAGGGLLYRGATGHCHVYDAMGVDTAGVPAGTSKSPYARGLFTGRIHVTEAVTIDKPAAELYTFWRNFQNLPIFMKHLESVTVTSDKLSHWKAKAPLGTTAEWNAELTSDIENEKIGWRSLDGSDVPNSGTVEFRSTPGGGTEVRVTLIYEAPGGKLGEWAAWMFGEEPGVQVAEDLTRFKNLMETGKINPTGGDPSRAESMAAKQS